VLFYLAREAAGALGTRLSLRPLFSRGQGFCNASGAIRAAGSGTHVEQRHCEERSDEAIHSSFARLDGLLRFARNDGFKLFALGSLTSEGKARGWPGQRPAMTE
jgi:hypothetical protein